MAPSREVAFSGRRLKVKAAMAILLSSIIPFLILLYVQFVVVFPLLEAPAYRAITIGLKLLALFTAILMVGGAVVIWDITRAIIRVTALAQTRQIATDLQARGDEIGNLMSSFSQMLGTIERQAEDLNQFAARLDTAYRELEQTNAKLKEYSFKDDLTGLYNRRFFTVRLEEEISRFHRFGHPLSVLMMDVDFFKAINDTYGHAAGDRVLQEVAQFLIQNSRGITVISRFGGDEFAILLVETPKEGARAYAERILGGLAAHRLSPNEEARAVTASIGFATLPEDAEGADALLHVVDEALYEAKRLGRNRCCAYDPAHAGQEERTNAVQG